MKSVKTTVIKCGHLKWKETTTVETYLPGKSLDLVLNTVSADHDITALIGRWGNVRGADFLKVKSLAHSDF